MTTLSKADYLKRYMSDGGNEKPKKRRKKVQNSVPVKKVVAKSRIVDDDVDLKSLTPQEEVDPYADEENPTVAEVIDERPEHVKELEKYRNEKWKQVDKKSRHDSESDESPKRRTRHDSGSESDDDRKMLASKSRNRQDSDSDQSPRQRCDSDSDQSPPRSRSKRMDSDSDQSPPRQNRNSDSDQSPPRHRKTKANSDSDQSPPRHRKGKANSDSDQSPPRKSKRSQSPGQSPVRSKKQDSHDKTVKTSRGAKAGLSSAKEMREEMQKLRKKEEDAFKRMDKSNTGENAATVIRDKSGKIVDMHAEMKKDRDKREKDAKYSRWSKGLTQQTVQNERVEEAIHEMAKPLARYKDDNDLDAVLKDQDRDGDPMLAFMKPKKSQTKKGGKSMPRYSGPAPPPNRFNIAPGYRWDGVDRYNGYEKKYFEQINAKKAKSQAAFMWSTEDM